MALFQMVPPFEFASKPKLSNKERTVAFADNKEFKFDINKGPTVYGLDLRLAGTYAVPPAGSAGPMARRHNPAELFANLQLEANGRDTIKNLSGLHAYVLQQLRRSRLPKVDGITTIEASTATGTFDFDISLYLDLVELGCVPQHFGAIPTRLLESLTLKGMWGNGAAAIADNPTAGTVVTGTAELGLRTVDELEPSPIAYGALLERAIRDDVGSVTDPARRIRLDKGGFIHWLVLFTFTGANKNLSDAVFSADGKVVLKIGDTVRFERTPAQIKALQKELLPEGFDDVGIYVIPFLHNDSTPSAIRPIEQALEAPQGVDVDLFAPVSGASGNVVEVLQVMQRSPTVTAGTWNLA